MGKVWVMLALLMVLIRTLTGQALLGDIAQDFYGLRALALHLDPYLSISQAMVYLGINWNVTHASTHPPTAYLLTAPVAFLPWPLASALWGWMMLAAIVASLRLYGLRWRWVATVMAVCLFWPPLVYSLSQLTPLWMLGLALAYHNREKPLASGVWIAFASLTKFLPALLLIPFIFRRKWSAVSGFVTVWLVALALVFALQSGAIARYVEINQSNSIAMMGRLDNGAFLPGLLRLFGWPGLAVGLTFLAVMAWLGHKNWHMWEFLAVALLPIAWVYSLLPLLPGIMQKWTHPLTVALIIITLFMPPFGPISAVVMLFVFLLAGIAILLNSPKSPPALRSLLNSKGLNLRDRRC